MASDNAKPEMLKKQRKAELSTSNIHQKYFTDEKRKQGEQTIPDTANDEFLFS